MTKKELRRTMKARNLSFGAEARSVASARIFGRVGELPAFAAAHTVALFSALPDEPDTGGVAERWRAAGKRLVLPRVEGDAMRFCDCDPAALRRGAFGIAEPEPGARTCPPGEIDLVVVPGVPSRPGVSGWDAGRGITTVIFRRRSSAGRRSGSAMRTNWSGSCPPNRTTWRWTASWRSEAPRIAARSVHGMAGRAECVRDIAAGGSGPRTRPGCSGRCGKKKQPLK